MLTRRVSVTRMSRYLGDLKKIKDIMSTSDYESGDDDFINNIKQIIDKY